LGEIGFCEGARFARCNKLNNSMIMQFFNYLDYFPAF
jgi:hypothetical protein